MPKKTSEAVDSWTLAQINDPAFLDSLIPQFESLSGLVDVQFSDGILRVSKRTAFLNLFWWQILTKLQIPICKRHFAKYKCDKPITKGSMVDFLNPYYDEIMDINPHNAKKLKQAIWEMLQKLYVFCCDKLPMYAASVDILDMAEILNDPAMKPGIDTKYKITPSMGTSAIEKKVEEESKRIQQLLGTKGALKNDALYTYQVTGQLNKFQVPQSMYMFGVRTDVSDNIIGLPVIGSAVDGLNDIYEFAVESLSAKKSAFYNRVAVADSQYFSRKEQLLCSSIRYIYPGDCHSQLLVHYNVTEQNYKNLVGKLTFVEGQPVWLTYDNIKNFIGQTIYMRSPMTCRYRKGVCEVCGGRIFNNINRKMNIGLLCAIQVIAPTTQKILSAKHLVKTLSIIYELPKKASEVLFRSSTSEIRWKPNIFDFSKMWMGVPQKSFPNIHDTLLLRADKAPKEERFSSVSMFSLRNQEGERIDYDLNDGTQIPFFSAEMLFHIRDHFSQLQTDEEMVWIPLAGTDKLNIFKTIVINDNMLQFVNKVSGFLSDKIKNYTSCNDALQDFSDIIYSKASANISHLEVMLKAYQLTSPYDFRVPRVTDPDNVCFQTTASILNNRHIGTKMAFQGLLQYMSLPSTYLVPKMESCFDPMVGY